MHQAKTTICEGCGVITNDIQGPIHPYILSSPGCWKLYSEVLAREYSDKKYWTVHRLTVDAYAVQHPGNQEDPRAIQSVNAHLVSLYIVLEKQLSYEFATKTIGKLIQKNKNNFIWLERPKNMGEITILDVSKAINAEEHAIIVNAWANSAWQAWSKHHNFLSKLIEKTI